MDLEVLTLNCWGLLLVSKHRRARIKFLGEYLEKLNTLDVVVLQEVWVGADAKLLISCAAKGGLMHSMHFRSGMFGSGLVTLSRYPIVESGFWRYSASGDPSAISCGDFYAGKGFGWVRISTLCGPVDVFNTHLHANYSHKCKAMAVGLCADAPSAPSPKSLLSPRSQAAGAGKHAETDEFKVPGDMAAGYRVCQMLELAQVMRHVSKWGSVGLVLAGDLNTKPDFLESALLRTLMPELHDSWAVLHNDEAGHTCKAPGNSFQPRRQVSERIDYVMSTFTPTKSEIMLQKTAAGYSYSDHFAVRAVLSVDSLRSDPSTLLMSPRGSAGLSHGSFTSTKHVALSDNMLHQRQIVFKSALGALSRGALLNRRNANINMGISAVMLLLGIALGMNTSLSAMPLAGGILAALPMSMLSAHALACLTSLTLIFFSALFFIMGFVVDSAQQRVLQQAGAQLTVLLGT